MADPQGISDADFDVQAPAPQSAGGGGVTIADVHPTTAADLAAAGVGGPTPAASAPISDADFELTGAPGAPPTVPQLPVTPGGLANQAAIGAVGGASGITNSLLNMFSPAGMLNRVADYTDMLGNLIGAASGDRAAAARFKTPDVMAGANYLSAPSPIGGAQVADAALGQTPGIGANTRILPQTNAWLGTQPGNEPERIARVGGGMALAALAPEDAPGLIPQLLGRTANVVLPTLGSEGARASVAALGGDQNAQDVASTVGAFGAGAAGRARVMAPTAEAPAPLPEVGDVARGPANRAVAYVASRMPQVSNPTMAAADASGKPVILAQRAGNTGIVALGSTARRPGVTGDALEAYATDPQTGVLTTQAQRLQQDFAQATGINPAAAAGDIDGLVTSLREGPAAAAYTKALSGTGPVWNPTLAALAKRPTIQKAMATAAGALQDAGKDPTQIGLAVDPATGAPVASTDLAESTQHQPTAEAWDLTKKLLGRMVLRYENGKVMRSGDEGILNDKIATASADLTSALRDAIPGYGEALDKGGDYLSLQKAFDDGQTHAGTTNTDSRAVAKYAGGLSPAERQAYAGGFANKLWSLADNGRLTPKTYSTPAFKTKLTAAVGPDAAGKILAGAQQESAIGSSLTRALPKVGSPTAPFNAEMQAQDEPPPLVKHGAEFVTNTVIAGPHVAGIKLGMNLAGKIPQLLTKPFQMSQTARDAAGGLLMSPTLTPEQVLAYRAQLAASKPKIGISIPQISGAR